MQGRRRSAAFFAFDFVKDEKNFLHVERSPFNKRLKLRVELEWFVRIMRCELRLDEKVEIVFNGRPPEPYEAVETNKS